MMFFICHKFLSKEILESLENYSLKNPEKMFDIRVYKNYLFGQIRKDYIEEVESFFKTLDIPEEEILIECWE